VEMQGWSEDLSGCHTESDLPDAAREYLRFVAEFVGVPIALIGVGPGPEQVIWTKASQDTVIADAEAGASAETAEPLAKS